MSDELDARLRQATFRVRAPGQSGTGFLVTDTHVLTARHVVEAILEDGVATLHQANCKPLDAIVVPAAHGEDYALLEIIETPDDGRDMTPLLIRRHVPRGSEWVALGYVNVEHERSWWALTGTVSFTDVPRPGGQRSIQLHCRELGNTAKPELGAVDDRSPIAGCSGAAMLVGGAVVGILIRDRSRGLAIFGLPITAALENPEINARVEALEREQSHDRSPRAPGARVARLRGLMLHGIVVGVVAIGATQLATPRVPLIQRVSESTEELTRCKEDMVAQQAAFLDLANAYNQAVEQSERHQREVKRREAQLAEAAQENQRLREQLELSHAREQLAEAIQENQRLRGELSRSEDQLLVARACAREKDQELAKLRAEVPTRGLKPEDQSTVDQADRALLSSGYTLSDVDCLLACTDAFALGTSAFYECVGECEAR